MESHKITVNNQLKTINEKPVTNHQLLITKLVLTKYMVADMIFAR